MTADFTNRGKMMSDKKKLVIAKPIYYVK